VVGKCDLCPDLDVPACVANCPNEALVLVEEFRCVIVDSVVLNLVNRRRLDAGDFEAGTGGGVYLTTRGLRVFFEQYSGRLQTEVKHPLAGRSLTYQKCFELQARLLRQVIEGDAEVYRPFVWR
jgi:CRISPR-associated protein Cas1